eukprot:COSAG06_NODE_798_length_12214_cov_11.385987_2_plen_150_part_00
MITFHSESAGTRSNQSCRDIVRFAGVAALRSPCLNHSCCCQQTSQRLHPLAVHTEIGGPHTARRAHGNAAACRSIVTGGAKMQLKVVDEAPELAAVGVCIRPSGIIAGQQRAVSRKSQERAQDTALSRRGSMRSGGAAEPAAWESTHLR